MDSFLQLVMHMPRWALYLTGIAFIFVCYRLFMR
jgi:hypothetical protein